MTDDLDFFITDTIKEIMVTYDHLRKLETRLSRLREMENKRGFQQIHDGGTARAFGSQNGGPAIYAEGDAA